MATKNIFKALTLLLFCIAVFISILPYLHGKSLTTPGYTYLGTVHYPVDYFYYVSQIAQGDRNVFLVDYIWGSETIAPTLVGWLYTSFGAITHRLNITPILSYQIYLGISTALYVISTYILLRIVFPKSHAKPFVGLFFSLFSCEIPKIIHDASGWRIFYEKIWFNYGEPFVRWDPVPHHIIVLSAVIMLFVLVFLYWKIESTWRYGSLLATIIPVFILATAHPIQLLLVIATLGVSFLLQEVPAIVHSKKIQFIKLISHWAPLIMICAVAAPILILMNQMLNIPPYNMSKPFEAGGNEWTHITIVQFFQFYGVVAIIGILSIPVFLKKKNPLRSFLIIYLIFSFGLYFSPIPEKIMVLNLRFLSAITILALAASATEGLFAFIPLHKRFGPIITTVLVLGVGVILALPFKQELDWKIFADTNNNAFYYIPTTWYDAAIQARNLTKPDEVILGFWPFDKLLPPLTGKKVFSVHELETIDYDKKNVIMDNLVNNRVTADQMLEIFKIYKIKTVLLDNASPMNKPPYLVPAYKNQHITVYRVSF